jgi:hypothetical protein
MSEYRTDYPSEPIGDDNPYYCCEYCKVPEPEINGVVENHAKWCEWRKKVEKEELIECSECGEEKYVEKGTWALEKGMCEKCYCIYQGG